jgi:hypothetical protein
MIKYCISNGSLQGEVNEPIITHAFSPFRTEEEIVIGDSNNLVLD